MPNVTLDDLTQTTLDGTGVFDVLMRANKAHLAAEFDKGRIKGTEYATVYLGSLEAVLRTSLEFLVQRQQIANLVLQAENIPKEGLVLDGQKCKLDAEFDLLQSEKLKSIAETTLLTQKNATEKAQTITLGVDVDSVIGKQKALYGAQAAGFQRDAEQKAAKLLIDTWNVRRTTDPDAADVNVTNKLTDSYVGDSVTKLLAGIGV